jgi:hypothetical protein
MTKTVTARKAIKAAVKDRRIINAFDVLNAAKAAGADPTAILYRPYQGGRAAQSAAWQVHRLDGERTEDSAKGGHWRDHGRKTFNVRDISQDKGPQAEAAKAWASGRYGVTAWEWLPGVYVGGWFPTVLLDAVEQMLATTDWSRDRAG